MVQYNFKKMTIVPNGKDFIDIILWLYAISRLRQFYMRKVKYTQQNFHEKLSRINDEFLKLDDIHPFDGNLLHVLYNKDHYKLALGQINTARNLIGKISKESEIVEVAALGRMCTVIKRIDPSLAYLEQIRQHVARLPSIDPNTRTVLICGYPNVGKNYKYLRYQLINTPGILDRPFEDSLAHLRAAALFFLDISGSCGYNIAQQTTLFHSIKSLVMNKPLVIVCNKTDLQPFDGISEEDKKLVGQGGEATNDEAVLLTMSTLIDEGVMSVKNAACQRLLNQRVELKMKSKKVNDCLNRFHVAMRKPCDNKERPLCIPQVVLEAKSKQAVEKEKRSTERDLENENGGAGVYSASLKKHYILANDEWKEDVMPEILDGHNVYDFEKEELLIQQHRIKKSTAESRPIVPRKFNNREFTTKRMGRQLTKLGIYSTMAINRAPEADLSPGFGRGRGQLTGVTDGGFAMDIIRFKSIKRATVMSMISFKSSNKYSSFGYSGQRKKDEERYGNNKGHV
ncbi:unnamed protein product [Malus baccata var. baccata]